MTTSWGMTVQHWTSPNVRWYFPDHHCKSEDILRFYLFIYLFTGTSVFALRVLYLMCIWCILGVFVVPYVYLLYHVCIAVVTLDAGLMARSQYPESPATGHLDTGFSWFPSVYRRMLRWFPSFQVATTCLSCSPPDLNFLVSFFFHICVHVI